MAIAFRYVFAAIRFTLMIGWVVPIWLGIDSVVHWLMLHPRDVLDSFPYLRFARDMFRVGCVWGILGLICRFLPDLTSIRTSTR
jgi:hypothetical protein